MLYQQINNEALDEDRKADLEVIRRLKKNYIENKEKLKEEIQLDSIQKNTLKKNLSAFERQLYKIIGYIEGKRETGGQVDTAEITELISNVIISFNNLCLYIQSLSYNRLTEPDKQYIARQFNSFIASIQLSIEILKPFVEDVILSPLSEMIDKIKLRIYEPISFNVSTIATELPKKSEFRIKRVQLEKDADIFNKVLSRNGILKPQAEISDTDLYNSLKALGKKARKIPRLKGARYDMLEELFESFKQKAERIEEEDENIRNEEELAEEKRQIEKEEAAEQEQQEEQRKFSFSELGMRQQRREALERAIRDRADAEGAEEVELDF